MKKIILITILTSIFSCTESKKTEEPLTLESAEIPKENPVVQTEDSYIVHDSIIQVLLGFPEIGKNIDDVKLNLFRLEKAPETNTHNPTVIDTIYKYRNNSGQLSIYKAADRYILSNFNIQRDFIFKNNLRIGSSKLEFSTIMKLETPKNDTVFIGDLEQNATIEFIFKNDKLTEVKYEGYVD